MSAGPQTPELGAKSWRARIAGRLGLSSRVLLLTILFVMVAEVLIYVPSVASFRRSWLNDRLAAARIAALVLDAAPEGQLSEELETKLLEGVGAHAVAVRGGGRRQILTAGGAPVQVDQTVDLRTDSWADLIGDAFGLLVSPSNGAIRVVGPGLDVEFVEVVLDQDPLREAMLEFSRNILLLSLFISGITAGLLYVALQWVIVRPVRRLSRNVTAFAGDPEDASRVIRPSRRADEIGAAERALAQMQSALAGELRQKRRLAELGLAVSKINHELRNMLTTAQLMTDRLERVSDESVQRVAPRLMATLSRAIAFCEATLAYGRAAERPPERRRIRLASLVAELHDLTDLAPGAGIQLQVSIPEDLEVDADPDQLSRALVNLVRNAVQAIGQAPNRPEAPRIAVTAKRMRQAVTIRVTDNGPGVPARAKAHLFSAFRSSVRAGGAGLGLAVTADLVRLHGGSIVLEETAVGASFRIVIPDAAPAELAA